MQDRQLLDRYLAQCDESAFAQLVRSHADWVYGCARRLVKNDAMAEDVTQATFALLARKARQIGNTSHLGGWLFQATRLCAKEALRAAARRQKHEREAAMERETQQSSPADAAMWAEVETMLDESVAGLRAADRDAILLRFYQRIPLVEIGERLGVGEDAARKRVDRAVERLRQVLAGRGLTASSLSLAPLLATELGGQAPQALIQAIIGHALPATSTAGTIAAAAGKTMTLAKAKLAAGVCLIAMAAAGTTSVIYTAVSSPQAPTRPATAAPIAPAAAVASPASPLPAAPANLSSVPSVFSYHLIADAMAAEELKLQAKAQPSSSTGYSAYRLDQRTLHAELADWQKRGTMYATEMETSNSLRLTSPVQIVSSADRYPISFSWPAAKGETIQRNVMLQGSSYEWFDRRGGGNSLRILPAQLTLNATSVNRTGHSAGSATLKGSIAFGGTLAPGEALLFISEAQDFAGKKIVHIRTYETSNCEYGEDAYLYGDDSDLTIPDGSAKTWIAGGPAGLIQRARQALAWNAMAEPDTDITPPGSVQTLSDGVSVRLLGIADTSRWPRSLWDIQGNPVRWTYVVSPLVSPNTAGHRQLVFELLNESKPLTGRRIPRNVRGRRMWTYTASFNSRAGRSELTLGAGAGPWTNAGRLEVGKPLTAGEAQVELRNVSQDANFFIPTLRYTRPDRNEWILWVVGKDGSKTRDLEFLAPLVDAADAPPHRTINGPVGKPSDIDHLEISWRPRKWVTFRGYATEPRVAPPTDVSVEQVRTARHAMFEKDDALLQAQVAQWRTIVPGDTSPQALMRLMAEAAEKGDTAAIVALFEKPRDDKERELTDFWAQMMVMSQRLPMLLQQRLGRETARVALVGSSTVIEDQAAAWNWLPDVNEVDAPTGCLVRKQADGRWRLAHRPEMLQMSLDTFRPQVTFFSDITKAMEDGSLSTLQQVQERFGQGMIDMLEKVAKQATSAPAAK